MSTPAPTPRPRAPEHVADVESLRRLLLCRDGSLVVGTADVEALEEPMRASPVTGDEGRVCSPGWFRLFDPAFISEGERCVCMLASHYHHAALTRGETLALPLQSHSRCANAPLPSSP